MAVAELYCSTKCRRLQVVEVEISYLVSIYCTNYYNSVNYCDEYCKIIHICNNIAIKYGFVLNTAINLIFFKISIAICTLQEQIIACNPCQSFLVLSGQQPCWCTKEGEYDFSS